jgi:Flp pilus assembly protein CpaB
MRSRGVVVVLALVLATIATASVFLYSRSVKQDAIAGGDLRDVVVSKVDIPTNSDLDAFISQGQFELLRVPVDTLVEGAVTDIAQLRGQRTTAFIFAGEQIPISRVESGEIPGGTLGIPKGHQAISVTLDGPRAIAGAVTGGDNVSIYATFQQVKISLIQKDFPKALQQGSVGTAAGELPAFDTTVVLAPEVEVLRVTRETDPTNTEQTESAAAQGAVTLTLAFLPDEAQRFVFAMEMGSVYLSLLPPDEAGTELDPLTFARVFLPEKTK